MTQTVSVADETSLSDRCFDAGRRHFPEIAWDRPGFEAASRVRWQDADLASLTRRLLAGRGLAEEYLVMAVLARVPGAIRVLDEQYVAPLRPRLERVCRNTELTDDVLQRVREKLLLDSTRLASYDGRGKLAGWVSVVAMRTALDARRERNPGEIGAQLSEQLACDLVGPEQDLMRRQFQRAFTVALHAAVRSLPPQQRFALRMNVLGNWSIDQIGHALVAHRATAARWLVAARKHVEDSVNTQLRASFSLQDQGLSTLLQQLSGQLDLRLSSLFATQDADALGFADG